MKVCISSTPLVSAVNHMAAQTFREEKTNNKKPSLSLHLILTSTLVNLDDRERARARNKPILLEEKHETDYIAAVRK